MSDQPTITIEVNGQKLEAAPGQMLIEVTDAAGITVPRFCYHKKLSVSANCRMCLVEVENAPKPLPACATPVNDGMKVFTNSRRAREAQKGTMEFLLINHPLDCPICDQGGECELQDLAMGYGSGVSRFVEGKRVVVSDDIGPLVATDMTRCIHCTRCVRFGEEIAGIRELGATGRGEHTRIGVYIKHSMSSELSGNIIDLCPVGALTSKPFRFRARAWEMTRYPGIAAHDGVGSNVDLHVRGQQVMRVVPRENEEVNETWISDRDRFSYQGLYSRDRLTRPMMRIDGSLQPVEWQEILLKLSELFNTTDHQRLGALASPDSTLEELYLLRKLLRGIGCANMDHRLRQADTRGETQNNAVPWLGQSFADLERSGATLLIGSWLRKDQPLLNHRVRKSVLAGGVVMAVNSIDYSFNYELTEKRIQAPAAMVGELAALVKAAGGDDLGLAANVDDVHQRMADTLAKEARSTVLLGAQAHMHPDFSLLRILASRLAAATNSCLSLAPPGANTLGACMVDMLPAENGLSAAQMLESGLDTCLLLNLDPEFDSHDPQAMKQLVENAQCVAMHTHVTPWLEAHADYLLPIAAWGETSGTLVNLQGDAQSFTGAVMPPGEARPAWKILRVLGSMLDLNGFDFEHSLEVRDEALQAASTKQKNNAVDESSTDNSCRLQQAKWQRIADLPAYQTDALVRRAQALQHTPDGWRTGVAMCSESAAELGVASGDQVRVRQQDAAVSLPVKIDDRVPLHCVWLPLGVEVSESLAQGYAPVTVEKG